MTFTFKTLKMLWGRAAGRCSYPDCKLDLYEDETEIDDPTLIGENCHIIAEADNGPRGNPEFPVERRNVYGNLILLCRNHHKIIDAQPQTYTVEGLHLMKREHEEWVSEALGLDPLKQRDDEYYAGLVDQWDRLAHLETWLAWSSHVLSHGQPSMSEKIDADLMTLRTWLLNRVWPGRYPELEAAFQNFRRVLQDFHETLRSELDRRPNGSLFTRRFYKIGVWDDDLYHKLLRRYEWHVDLVQDLMLELTRAANWICDTVRRELTHSYRLSSGRIMVQSGPYEDLSFHDSVVLYSEKELGQLQPYPGLEAFLYARASRDTHFGKGDHPS